MFRGLLILSSLILTSCGVVESIPAKGTGDQKTLSDKAQPSEAQTPLVKKQSFETALLIAEGEIIPDCSKDNKSQLIYVTDLEQFQACNGNKWQVINIAGKDGKDGKDGHDGKNGTDGINGKSGADAPIVAANQWLNPLTKKYWLRTGIITNSQLNSVCGTDGTWSLASGQVLLTAISQGMGQALPSELHRAWNGDSALVGTDTSFVPLPGVVNPNTQASAYCVQNG